MWIARNSWLSTRASSRLSLSRSRQLIRPMSRTSGLPHADQSRPRPLVVPRARIRTCVRHRSLPRTRAGRLGEFEDVPQDQVGVIGEAIRAVRDVEGLVEQRCQPLGKNSALRQPTPVAPRGLSARPADRAPGPVEARIRRFFSAGLDRTSSARATISAFLRTASNGSP